MAEFFKEKIKFYSDAEAANYCITMNIYNEHI